MSVTITIDVSIYGTPPPKRFTDRTAMLNIGNVVGDMIVTRTLAGQDADGNAFANYSTEPTYISKGTGTGTGARLAPKGGRVSRTGRSVYYAGGYREFKQLSRKPGQAPRGGATSGPTSEVDLTLSGQLMRSIEVAQADEDSVVIQTGPGTVDYAAAVNERRRFMGLTPANLRTLDEVVLDEIEKAMGRMARR